MLQCTQRAGSICFFTISVYNKNEIGTPFGETYLSFFVGTILQQSLTLGRQGAAYSLLTALFRFASARIIHDFSAKVIETCAKRS